MHLVNAIDERTRMVTLSSVPFTPGRVTDLAPIGAACRERGVFLLVDAVQSVGILETDVEALGIDAFAVSTQKGLLGLYGMGFLLSARVGGAAESGLCGALQRGSWRCR
ncbi:MAG: cysteine desulfurase/selenocysteine lyase [Gammaproteobacteria bacterium]